MLNAFAFYIVVHSIIHARFMEVVYNIIASEAYYIGYAVLLEDSANMHWRHNNKTAARNNG